MPALNPKKHREKRRKWLIKAFSRTAKRISFSLKTKKTFSIYNSIFNDLLRFHKRKTPPSIKEVDKINSKLRKLKQDANFLVSETLELEKTLGKEKMTSVRHKLRDKISNLLSLIAGLERKFGITDIESIYL